MDLHPLVRLVKKQRKEVRGLQRKWEALGAKLEMKRRRLKLAEDTLGLLRQREETASEDEMEASDSDEMEDCADWSSAGGSVSGGDSTGEDLQREQASEGLSCAYTLS
jgi:hypothetical protein